MEHDSPTLLFRLTCEYLISAKVIRPGPVTVVKRVAHAREVARQETFDRLAHEFTDERRVGLDGLLVTDPAIGMTRLRWLGTGPVEASPAAVNNDDTKAVSRSRIDRLCRRRDVPLREKTLWRMLYESASRASAVLALNIEDLDLPNKQARVTVEGGDTMWITWGTDTAHLLPRLIAGRARGPLFLSAHRPGPHRRATTDPRDLGPDTGRVRLGYDRARILLGHYGDGLRLHQLRHSSATHLGDANTSANVIMAKTGHKSLRSVQRYVKPGLAAVHQATEVLSSPRRRG